MIVEEIKEEESNANNVTTDTFIQPPFMTNTPREKTEVENDRKISPDSLTETIKGFNKLTLDSTINDSAYYHSKTMSPKAIHWYLRTLVMETKEKSLILTLPKEIPNTNY